MQMLYFREDCMFPDFMLFTMTVLLEKKHCFSSLTKSKYQGNNLQAGYAK